MKRTAWNIVAFGVFFFMTVAAHGQEFTVAMGASGLKAPSAFSVSPTSQYAPQSIGGGTFLTFSGDILFKKYIGFEGDASVRANRNLYQAFGLAVPFRPIFYSFNAIYAPPLGKRAQAEFLGGIGGESTRFYSDFIVSCSTFSGCTNFSSSNHFLGDVGAGLRLYVHHNVFIRPEVRFYFVHNNLEFSGANSAQYGVSLGYTLRSQ